MSGILTRVVELTAPMLREVVDGSPLTSWPHAVAVRAANGQGADACGGRIGGVAVTVGTSMYGASIAKQVIGLLAAQQAVGGLLDPEGVLAGHLDGLPAWAARVRLRHLIHHTSGLADDQGDPGVRGNAEVLSRLSTAERLLVEPGSAYRYSNIGYICLAEVVSRIAGRDVEVHAERLFASLGMTSARLGGPMPGGLKGQRPPPRTVGDGGLWLSAFDLRRWNDAMNDRVLGHAVHALAETPGTLDDGTPLDYAWGVRILEHVGRRTVSHGGSWPTWSAKALRQPELGVSIAILTTCEDPAAVAATALDLADWIAT